MKNVSKIADLFIVPIDMSGYVLEHLPRRGYIEWEDRIFIHSYIASIVVTSWLKEKQDESRDI